VYTFRAWIDEDGFNEDRNHERHCTRRCEHLRMWDLNLSRNGRNILRITRRLRPPYLHIVLGPRYWRVLRVGKPGKP